MADYPAAAPTFTNVVDVDASGSGGTDIDATYLNATTNELSAVIAELGLDPAGGYADVVTRLDAIDTSGATYLLLDGSRVMTGDLDMDIYQVNFDPDGDADIDMLTVEVTGSPKLFWDESEDAFRLTHGLYIADNDGIDINSGSDEDHDLITVGVTGTPTMIWDESEDRFSFNKGIEFSAGGLKITSYASIGARAMWPSTTSGCADAAKTEYGTQDVDLYQCAFDKDSDEYAQYTMMMPPDWDASTITATFFWTTATGDGGAAETVTWGCQGRAYANDDGIDQAWGTAQTVADTWIADLDMHTTSATSAITLAGTPAAGEPVQLRFFRDVSEDDLAADAQLLGVRLAVGRVIS